MTPLHISDPVPARRQSHQTDRKSSSFMSAPMMVMMIAAIAGIPPIANRLVMLDTVVHANNDKIVFYLLATAPFLMVGVAVGGLWLMFGNRQKEAVEMDQIPDASDI